jgi:hypothetical protein
LEESEVSEVKIIVSNEEQKFVQKHLCYEKITISRSDQTLGSLVESALNDFKGSVDEIDLVIKFKWR